MSNPWKAFLEKLMRDKPDEQQTRERGLRVGAAVARAARVQARVRALETEIRVVRRRIR